MSNWLGSHSTLILEPGQYGTGSQETSSFTAWQLLSLASVISSVPADSLLPPQRKGLGVTGAPRALQMPNGLLRPASQRVPLSVSSPKVRSVETQLLASSRMSEEKGDRIMFCRVKMLCSTAAFSSVVSAAQETGQMVWTSGPN